MADEAEGEVVVPPTLHALLAARLDQLEPAERRILECGAIEGEIFHRGAIQALAPEETQVTPRLAALVRKELIRPDRPQIAGEDGFRFRHLLIRDAAYEALPKSARADLHQRLGAWLEEHGTELVELDEILGYHLEQALAYRVELGLPDDPVLAGCGTAASDGRRLARARASGLRCRRAPPRARCRALCRRRRSTSPSSSTWTKPFLDGQAEEALRRAEALAERAAAADDRLGELCGRIQAGIRRLELEGRGGEAGRARRAGAARAARGCRRRRRAVHRVLRRSDEVAIRARGRTGSARTRSDLQPLHARRAGLVDEHHGLASICRLYGHDPRRRARSRGSTRTSHEPARIMVLRAYRAMVAREARSIRRSTRAARRLAGGARPSAAGALLLGELTAIESNIWSRARWRCCRRRGVRSRRLQRARAARRRRRLPARAQLRVSPRRSTARPARRGAIRGRRARPSSARATTP